MMFSSVISRLPFHSVTDYLFIASFYLSIFLFLLIFISITSVGRYAKYWILFLLLLSAIISYIIEEYHVVFDETMLRNIFETDRSEATDLLSINWLFYVLLFGFIPALILSKIKIKERTYTQAIVQKSIFISILLILLSLNIAIFYSHYASLLRTHRHLKDYVVPTGFLHSAYKLAKESLPIKDREFVIISSDAKFTHIPVNAKKMVFVFVVGETARVANFSLAGYKKNTNPLLSQQIKNDNNLIFFPEFYSCGTSTSISVPCIFSSYGRNKFDADDAKHRENLLDILVHAGMDVIWIDNNSGCKGVCDRITHYDLRGRTNNILCNKYGCTDMVLVDELEKAMQTIKNNTVIILHQQGSHGPSYYERAPVDAQVFKPVCLSNHLPECTKTEITNSYDNTIVYTDYVLSNIVDKLRAHNEYNTGMFYVSDHGESLGENNLYLHGMPYSIAPDEQTHVPALLWLSSSFIEDFKINIASLKKAAGSQYSHDNIFHSLLGLMEIETTSYRSKLDFFHDNKSH